MKTELGHQDVVTGYLLQVDETVQLLSIQIRQFIGNLEIRHEGVRVEQPRHAAVLHGLCFGVCKIGDEDRLVVIMMLLLLLVVMAVVVVVEEVVSQRQDDGIGVR